MTRKPIVFLSALTLAALGLAACGGDSGENGEDAAPATASEEAPAQSDGGGSDGGGSDGGGAQEEGAEQEADQAEQDAVEQEEEAEDLFGDGQEGDTADDDAADDASGDTDPGPAPEDAVIPAEALTEPPQSIGQYTLMDGDGPAHMYSDENSSVMISLDTNVLGSPYESLVESIETDNTPAGTGSCGTNESGSSITCYQQTADGVITLTAIPEEISLEDMVVFVNQYAEQADAA